MFHLRSGYACQDAGIGTHWYSIGGSVKLLLQRLLGKPIQVVMVTVELGLELFTVYLPFQ